MNDNNEQQDRLHELLCKVVFGEATAAETIEVEGALEDSSELRAQKAEIEGTVALVRDAYPAGSDDALSTERFDAVVAAASAPAAPAAGKLLGGEAWFRRPLVRTAAVIAIIAGTGGVWWSGQTDRQDRSQDTTVAVGADGRLLMPGGTTLDGGSAARYSLDSDEAKSDLKSIGYDSQAAGWKEKIQFDLERLGEAPSEGAFVGVMSVDASDAKPDVSFGRHADARKDALTVDSYGLKIAKAEPVDGSNAGGEYRGPGDAAPPSSSTITAGRAPEAVAGQAGGGNGGVDSFRTSLATGPGSGGIAVVGLGGGGGAAPPGPGGPATPGPATPGTFLFVQPEMTTAASGGYSPEPAPSVRRMRKKSGETYGEAPERLKGLGYVAPDTDVEPSGGLPSGIENRRGAGGGGGGFTNSDDFFLGLGQSITSERLSPGQRWCRVTVAPTRLANERPRDMFFRFWGDNPFVITDRDAQSTFAADVDTASFTLARRMLREGFLPPREQVRTEEFVNFAKPDLAPPTEGTFALHGELAPSPFGAREDRWLLRVGVRAAEIERDARPPLALTFVVDTSGSMKENNRLELVKHAIRLLVGELDARDSIAIVRFSNDATEVLAPTSAAARDVIETALFKLQPGGSTNAEDGLKLGYALAERMLLEGVQTRVVFLSDGVANVGQTDQDRIANDVASSAARGIFLNTIGVGMANHNDTFLEQMANNGQGVCDYVGDAADARRAIVERFVGNFVTVAKDVKIQVEFDPTQVLRWRQIGYENRAVADKDFRNDAIDAGEIGAGHQVVCLYEIELPSGRVPADAPLATVRLRWKPVTTGEAQPLTEAVEIERTFSYDGMVAASFRAASTGFRRAALAAQLAECLRRSTNARGDSMRELGKELAQLLSEDRVEDTAMIADMTKRSIDLGLEALIPTPVAGDLEAQHREAYYDALIDSLGGADDPVESGSDQATYESRIKALLESDRGPQGH